MPTHREEIPYDAVDQREPLHVSGRLEPPHLALPLSRRLGGDCCAIVRLLICAVDHRWHDRAARRRVAAELVGDQPSGNTSLALQ